MKQSDDHNTIQKAIPYMYKILQFCPSKESFNLLHVLNMTDLPGTLISQGLKLLKEVHLLLTDEHHYATFIEQEFPKPTWYTLTDEGRNAQQVALHNALPGSLDIFVEATSFNANGKYDHTASN
jgi:hypothetical protein